jgi:hypothetical protein
VENAKLLEIGALQVYQLPGPETRSPEGAVRFEFEIGGTFKGRGIKSLPVTGKLLVVYILLNFVKFLKK